MSAALVLADDHPIVLDGLRRLFESEPGWCVKACCGDGECVLRAVEEHRPDLLILDLQMPRLHGTEVIRALADRGIAVPIVVLTAGLASDDLQQVLRNGVRGIVFKDCAPAVLLDCARSVLTGGTHFEGDVLHLLREGANGRNAAKDKWLELLTPREFEVCGLAVRGLRSKEIAAWLGITEGTVRIHLHNIYQKLGVTNRVELSNKVRLTGHSG